METLKTRLREVEDLLKERTASVDMLTKEHDRLLLVEGELNGIVQRLTGKLSNLKKSHQGELDRLLEARTTVEEALPKERDGTVQKLEVATRTHERALLAAQGQASEAPAALCEMDEQFSGKFFFISSGCILATGSLYLVRADLSSMVAPGCWPATEPAAEKAIEDNRQTRRENGEAITDGAAWSPSEYVLATGARLPLVKGAICAFKTGVIKLNQLIWLVSEQPVHRTPPSMWSTCCELRHTAWTCY